MIIFEAALSLIIIYQISKNLLGGSIRFQLKSLNSVDDLLTFVEENLSHVQKVSRTDIVRSVFDCVMRIMGNRSSS